SCTSRTLGMSSLPLHGEGPGGSGPVHPVVERRAGSDLDLVYPRSGEGGGVDRGDQFYRRPDVGEGDGWCGADVEGIEDVRQLGRVTTGHTGQLRAPQVRHRDLLPRRAGDGPVAVPVAVE